MFLSAKLQYSFRLYKEILKILFFFSHFSLMYGDGIIVNRTLVLFFVEIGKRKGFLNSPRPAHQHCLPLPSVRVKVNS